MATKKVYVGIGHGGSDSGAVSNGRKEKDLALDIGKACNNYLKKCGVSTKISRTTDKDVSINTKASQANSFGADLVLDIHLNAGGGDGCEMWVSAYATGGKKAGQAIIKQLEAIGQNVRAGNTGTKGIYTKTENGTDYFGMIRLTDAPAVIVECAFIDNTTDIKILDTAAERKTFGEAIAKGCMDYLGVDYEEEEIIKLDELFKVKLTTGMNVRTGPGTAYKKISSYAKNKVISIYDTNSAKTWGYTEKGWVCITEKYATKQ